MLVVHKHVYMHNAILRADQKNKNICKSAVVRDKQCYCYDTVHDNSLHNHIPCTYIHAHYTHKYLYTDISIYAPAYNYK